MVIEENMMNDWDTEWLLAKGFYYKTNTWIRPNTLGTSLYVTKKDHKYYIEWDLTFLIHIGYKDIIDKVLDLDQYYIKAYI